MPSTTRQNKRTSSQMDPAEGSTSTASQTRKRARSSQQGTLSFAPPPPPPSFARNTTTLRTSQSIEDSTEDTSQSSGHDYTIESSSRVAFDVDFPRLNSSTSAEYRMRYRNKKNIHKNRISWIFAHGLELEKKQNNGRFEERHWLCRYCYEKGDLSNSVRPCRSTTSITGHLRGIKNGHNIQPEGAKASHDSDNSALDEYTIPSHPLHAERFLASFINWTAACDITFEQAAHASLKDLIINGGPPVRNLLPCAKTVRSWLLSAFKERKPDVKQSLLAATSRINLSFDIWSTLNNLSLLGVVAHWLDEKQHLKTALLGLKRIHSHYGEADLAPMLQLLINEYSIGDKLGAFQMDNADNNDTCLKALRKWFTFDLKDSRLRCLGHVINLVVKALLFGEGNSALQKELNNAGDKEQFTIWRKTGAIGKLHNLVTYISRSDQRQSAFAAIQQEDAESMMTAAIDTVRSLKLIKDTGIRWNSTYYMIRRALKLEAALERYCASWSRPDRNAYDLTEDFLDPQDWEELRHFEELLEPFEKATKNSEGNAVTGSHGALWEVLPTMDYLFKKLKARADEVERQPHLFADHYQACLNYGFAKLRDYYTKADDSRLNAAAVALHPCKRFNYFEHQWLGNPDGYRYVDRAKQQTRSLFSEYIERERQATPPSIDPPSQSHDDLEWSEIYRDYGSTDNSAYEASHRRKQEAELDEFMTAVLDTRYTVREGGKLLTKSYLKEPLRWWRERGKELYPTVAKMAFDLFSIPAMSSECERAFSAAKRMITDERYNLKPDIIEADQCIKSWLKNGVVNGYRAFSSIAQDNDDDGAEQELIDVGYTPP